MVVRQQHAQRRQRNEHEDEHTDSASDVDMDGHGLQDAGQRGGAEDVARGPQASERSESRRKKPTYVARKQEKSSLDDEIEMLEARLELLKVKAGLPTDEETKLLANVQAANADIEEAIHVNLLGIARFQSLLAQHLLSTPVDPISAFIHLTRDPAERHATLRSMRDVKLRRATELVTERLGGLDPLKPYMSDERFITKKNVYRCKRADVHQFRGLPGGARQLFDALLHFVTHMEISITEMLGQLPIREDMDYIEPTLWNLRRVTTTGAGYVQELNTAGFARFVESPDDGQPPYGVFAVDAVDVDDLYPYTPSKHVRKDLTASSIVTEVPSDKNDPHSETVVVLKRYVFVTIHTPEFVLPTSVMDDVVASVSTWATVMAKFLHDTMAPPPRA